MVYIASPYSPIGWKQKLIAPLLKFYRWYCVTRAIGKLHDKFPYAFIGPITQSHHTGKHRKIKNSSFSAWIRVDLTYISNCDQLWVLMLPGWKKSVGVQAEIAFATSLIDDNGKGMKIRYIHPKTLKITTRP